ncbi:hypothetical protein QJQ45_023552, partial [Haematococcus lacustris]
LPPGVSQALNALLDEYADVFAPITSLPPERPVGHAIPLVPDARPSVVPQYRMSQEEHAELKKQVQDLLAKGMIEPSSSPFAAPILFVKKKSGELRMCLDYRQLNKITIRDQYPLPRIDDLFDKLSGCTVFSSLDLQAGYNQIRITPEDVPKTAFRTPDGHYQFKVLSFGLCNAPATFQRVMNDAFAPVLNQCALVYLDDILVMSKSVDEHLKHLRKVFDLLRLNKLYAKQSKCEFMRSTLKFLGHVIFAGAIAVDPEKIKSISAWPVPQSLQQLQSFLGAANFVRKFVHNFSVLAAPLTDLCGKAGDSFLWHNWPADELKAFASLKAAVAQVPMLRLPDHTQPFQVYCDASLQGVGAVLMQDGYPLAYLSKKLSSVERNYTTGEQELLALITACKEWRCYLEGVPFTLFTDHKPLTALPTQKVLSRRQARWMEFLSRFTFDLQYLPGDANPADPLSRIPAGPQDCAMVCVVTTRRQAKQSLERGEVRVAQALPQVPPVGTPSNAPTAVDALAPRPTVSDNPVAAHHSRLPELEAPSAADTSVHYPAAPAHPLELADHLVHGYRLDPAFTAEADLSSMYMDDHHSYKLVPAFFPAPLANLRDKSSTLKPGGLLNPLSIPDYRWESVSMDLITKLPSASHGFDAICVFVDRLSKMVHFVPCKESMNAKGFARLFVNNVFKLHGLPKDMVSDRGPHFHNTFWHHVQKLLGMRGSLSSSYHPQSDGQTERYNRVLEEMLRHYISPTQADWPDYLSLAEFAVNNSWQESIKSTPFLVNTGQSPITPMLHSLPDKGRCPEGLSYATWWQEAVAKAKLCMQAAQQRQAAYANQDRREVHYKVGQMVLLSTKNMRLKPGKARKLLPRFVGPFKVLGLVGQVAVNLQLPASMSRLHPVFHVSLIKSYTGTDVGFMPPPVEWLDEEPVYYVERLLDHRHVHAGKAKEYLVQWEGYDADHNTWEPRSNLVGCDKILAEYNAAHNLNNVTSFAAQQGLMRQSSLPERRERSDAAARSNSEQRKREYVPQHQERLAAQLTALQSVLQPAISEDWQHHALASGATRLEDSPLKALQVMQVEYISMQDRLKLTHPCYECASFNQSISPNPSPRPSSAGLAARPTLKRAFLEALNAAHHPLALYPPHQIRTDSFSQAFFDYLRAIDRILAMPSLNAQTYRPNSPEEHSVTVPSVRSSQVSGRMHLLPCRKAMCVIISIIIIITIIRQWVCDACNKPSSCGGVAKATRDLEQHTDTYLDRSGLEGAVQQLHDRFLRGPHKQRMAAAKLKCMELETAHGVHALEKEKHHGSAEGESPLIARGLKVCVAWQGYRTQVEQLTNDVHELMLQRDSMGQSDKDPCAASNAIKAKLKTAGQLLREAALYQALGSGEDAAAVSMTEEQLQAMVRGEPAPWAEASTATPYGKLLHICKAIGIGSAVGRLVLRDGLGLASLRPFINDCSNRPPAGSQGCASKHAEEASKL